MKLSSPLLPEGRVFYEDTDLVVPVFKTDTSEIPSLHIVIPTFNSGATLEKTIRSLLLQGHPRLFISVYDGGSKDETIDILSYYSEYLYRVISKPDEGQADVINKGFDLAPQCSILGWLNADDILLPNALHHLDLHTSHLPIKAAIKSDKAVMIVGDADLVDINLKLIHPKRLSRPELEPEILLDYRRNYIIQPSCFFTKRLWDLAGPNNPHLYAAFDFELFYKMSCLADHKVHIPEVLSYSVFHSDCKTVKQRHLSISETALIQAREGGFSIALREIRELSKEYKFLESAYQSSAANKPSLLISITEFGLGGAQTYLITLLSRLANTYQIYLYRLWDHHVSDDLLKKVTQYCHDITTYVASTENSLRNFIASHGIRLVMSNLYHSDAFMAKVCLDLNVKYVIVDHGDYRFVVEDNVADINTVLMIFDRADMIIYTSRLIRQQALDRYILDEGKRREKFRYIPLPSDKPTESYGPIDIVNAFCLPADSFLVSCSGRGIYTKGWSFVAEAVAIANSKSSRPIILIATGQGPVIKQLITFASTANEQTAYLRFLGFRKDAPQVSAACHASIMLSFYPGETLNLTLVEGLMAAKPCIATRWGAMGEVLCFDEPGSAGIPVSINNGVPSIDEAADALIGLANDQSLYHQLQANAKMRGEHYNADLVSAQYVDAIRNLIK